MPTMRESPSKSNKVCQSCGLWKSCKSPFMPPSVNGDSRVLVVGEAPGSEEDDKGVPFVGISGQFLRNVLEDVFGLDNVAFTNVVRCRPPDNKITKKAIDHCKKFVMDDISIIDPEIVLLMGNSPLSGVLGQTGISRWNGVVVKKDDRKYVPLYHPAFILRDASHMDEWLEAIISIEDDDKEEYIYKHIFPKTIEDLYEMKKVLCDADSISYDVETNMLKPYNDDAKIISFSFACEGKAYAFPFLHPKSWWTDDELDKVVSIVSVILAHHFRGIIGHNIKFDQMWTYATLGVWFEASSDSMIISHLLDSRGGIHGLKRLAGINLGMFQYDSELDAYKKAHKEADPERGGSYANIPLNILLPYGAKDAEATLRLEKLLKDKITDKQRILLEQLIMPASDELCIMQCNGFPIDKHIARRYSIIYRSASNRALVDIRSDKKVKKLSKDRQIVLDGEIVGTRRKRKVFKFNPGSPDQLSELYFRRYNIPVLAVSPKTGKPSTTYKAYKHLEGEFRILGKVRLYKLLGKMLSTYIEPACNGAWTSDDGKARTTFNLHTVVTGRTSSSDPVNFQNIPVPEKEPNTLLADLPIKNLFVTSHRKELPNGKVKYKGRLVSVDYSGMELRCFASLSHCMNMIRIIELGKDVHSCVAIMSMTGKLPDEITQEEIKTLPKPVRYVYKWTNWTLLYGGSWHTLHRMYNVPEDEAKETVRLYYGIFPEVLEYKKRCIDFALDNGYIESPFGRREYLPYIDSSDNKKRARAERECVNMPVQSGAGDTLLAAMVMVACEMRKTGLVGTKLVNEVHDSLVADCPDKEIVPYARLAKRVMENVKDYSKEYMPGIDWSWLIAPLQADVEVGTHYGTEIDFDEWLKENGNVSSILA